MQMMKSKGKKGGAAMQQQANIDSSNKDS